MFAKEIYQGGRQHEPYRESKLIPKGTLYIIAMGHLIHFNTAKPYHILMGYSCMNNNGIYKVSNRLGHV